MSKGRRVSGLFSKRVPLYLSLPIVLACGAAGFLASVMYPGGSATGPLKTQPSAEMREGPVVTSGVDAPAPREVTTRQVASHEMPLGEETRPAVAVTPAPIITQHSAEMGKGPVATSGADAPVPQEVTPRHAASHDVPLGDETRPAAVATPVSTAPTIPSHEVEAIVPPSKQADLASSKRSPPEQRRVTPSKRSSTSTRRIPRTAEQNSGARPTSGGGLQDIPLVGPVFSLFP